MQSITKHPPNMELQKSALKSFLGCFEKEHFKCPFLGRMVYFLYFPRCKKAGHFKNGLKITVSVVCNLEAISRKLP